MRVIHKGMLSRGRSVKRDEKFRFILNYVFPTRQMSRWWRTPERQYAKRRAVHMERMRHADRDDLPHFERSKLGLYLDAG